MTSEYRTEFLERIQRTSAANSYRFKRPEGMDFAPGQYMLVDLGGGLIHPLSLSDCPEEYDYIEFTKRMTGSEYCRRLESLKKGEQIAVKGPEGRFTLNDPVGEVILLAGGIGITPIRSILKSREKKGECRGRLVLIYGNKNKEDIAFRDELEHLRLADFKLVHVLSDTTGVEKADKGFITAGIIAREVSRKESAIYMVSGPPVMVKAVREALAATGVPEERIKTDAFMGYD